MGPVRAVACLAVLLLLAPRAAAQNAGQTEAQRLDQLIEHLNSLRSRVSEVEAEIDQLLQKLNAQKGALQSRPSFGWGAGGGAAQIEADPAPKVNRCAARTKDGDRCTRAAADGSRYCKQHQLAHQK